MPIDTLAVTRGGVNVFRQDYDYESADHRYEYEADGQRGGVVETRYDTAGSVFSSTYIDWEYDALNRLTKENYDSTDNAADFTATYTFDLVGNRVKKVQTGAQAGTTVSTYNERDQITANGVDADSNGIPDPSTATLYRHDPNGSTTKVSTSASSKLYLWDLRNRMTGYDSNGDDLTFDTVSGSTSVSLGNLNDAGDARFTYDSDGVRLSRTEVGTSSDTVTDYVQDTNNPTGYSQVLEERTNGSLDRSYVIGHSVLGQKDSNGTRQFVPDGHGSTRLLINPSTSTPVQVYDYDAYGNALWTATSQTSILYTNQLFDPIVQQYLLRARYYNQVLGTFSSFDEFEGDPSNPLHLHKYLYGLSDPIQTMDPRWYSPFILQTLGSIGIQTTLGSVAFSVSTNAIGLALDLSTGVGLGTAARAAFFGLATDAVTGGVFSKLKVLKGAGYLFKLRKAGDAVTRTANSVWHLADNYKRGRAIERLLLPFEGSLPWAFKTIDNFTKGVATSVKSIDLATGYKNVDDLAALAKGYADDLSGFGGYALGHARVAAADVRQRVLLIAIEAGGATREQAETLLRLVAEGPAKWPKITIVIQELE